MKLESKIRKEAPVDKSVRRQYHQRYRSEWERFPSFSHWLQPSNDGYSAHCKICDVNVLARLASIKQHHITRKHQEAMKCNDFLCKNLIKEELEAVMQLPEDTRAYTTKTKTKPKSKAKQKIKTEKEEDEVVDEDLASNDSMLDDLLGGEPLEAQYIPEEVQMDENQEQEAHIEEEVYEEINNKQDQEIQDDYNDELLSEDNMMSEFDLFGKSVALQLNNMRLEDALLCQERLQVVLTEFRLKILKRKREGKRSF
ncbi:hypothetical protein KR067_007926 [Drosophila pandora]|nr:hypothetical protein KR067_007926 [Drosophila pandora]